jgi:integrase
VSAAVQEHLVDMRERGLRSSSIERAERHLRRFFQLDEREGKRTIAFAHSGGMIDELRPKRCEELYAELRKAVEVDTHRNALAAAKAFGAWCVEKSWIRASPVEGVKPIGERNRGKPQLRIDEARSFVQHCTDLADDGHTGAIAVLTTLTLGLRASEVTDRVCRDLDDGGRLLWIPFGKTRRSKRALEVPEMLRPYLLGLVEGRQPDEQLFGRPAGRVPREWEANEKAPRDRHWVLRQTHVLCSQAKVPVVCAHSLRGLHATLATEAGATPHLVATALGHSSTQVAERHYTDGVTAHRAKTRKVVDRLASTPTPTHKGKRARRAGVTHPARLPDTSVGNGERAPSSP